MSGYKPSLVPTVLSTEGRTSHFLWAPTSQAQPGSRVCGATGPAPAGQQDGALHIDNHKALRRAEKVAFSELEIRSTHGGGRGLKVRVGGRSLCVFRIATPQFFCEFQQILFQNKGLHLINMFIRQLTWKSYLYLNKISLWKEDLFTNLNENRKEF